MAETYCGKSCEGCCHIESSECTGCKTGFGGDYNYGSDKVSIFESNNT